MRVMIILVPDLSYKPVIGPLTPNGNDYKLNLSYSDTQTQSGCSVDVVNIEDEWTGTIQGSLCVFYLCTNETKFKTQIL